MKILCLGDVHLGASPDFGTAPYGEGSRLDDQRKVLDRIVQLARDERVDTVAFVGDAFHRRRPTPTEILVWRDFLDALYLAPVQTVIAIPGNHDTESADRPTALDIVRNDSLTVSRRPEVIPLDDKVAFATLPWTPPARLVASMNGSVSRDEVYAVAAELLVESARELKAQIPEDKTSILLAHWSVSGSSLPNGLPVDQLREVVLPLPEIEELGFDYVVLGHIHDRQLLATNVDEPEMAIFYTGSPACVDFGEAKSEHGVWIIDTDNIFGIPHFVPIADRRFVTVDCDLTASVEAPVAQSRAPDFESGGPGSSVPAGASTLDETDAIAAAIAEHFPLTDAVVRIRFKATAEQARRVDVSALRKLCMDSGASKVFQVIPEIVREDRARVEGLTEALSVPDALNLYLASEGSSVSEERARELRGLTAELLEEVGA